jgi:hypothetical protein
MSVLDTGRTETWPRCPEASEFFISLFRAFAAHNPMINEMAQRMRTAAGVDILALIDYWALPPAYSLRDELAYMGMKETVTEDGETVWQHPLARLPRVRIDNTIDEVRMALAVENLNLFAEANDLPLHGQHGDPDSGYEEARYPLPAGELAVIVRQGYRGFCPGRLTANEERTLRRTREALGNRDRTGRSVETAEKTQKLLRSLLEEVHRDRLTDAFFAAERDYWMSRNRAGRWQYERQQEVGIGWANHDHHTYRSSRQGFHSLIHLWLLLGFEMREKFYAGAEAGWGAQILEHPGSRVVLFCDVDMAPDELAIDFSAADLAPCDTLGTIGLWCGLHSDSIGQAGLHHLEAEFDFTRVHALLESAGFPMMPPFTDLPMLKQAFTVAENWKIAAPRIQTLLELGLITQEQADRFEAHGAPGSHLEILQRWEGFKGFNKTGINAIIRETDARNSV